MRDGSLGARTIPKPARVKPTHGARVAADELIIAQAEKDVEAGVGRAIELVHAGHSRPVAIALDGLVRTAIRTLRVRERVHDEVGFVLALARRHAAGEDAATLAAEGVPELLRRKRTHLVVRVNAPSYGELVASFEAALTARLPDLARLVAVDDAADYPALLRTAFPDRAEADAILDEQAVWIREVIAHFGQHPDLLRVPRRLVARLVDTAGDMIEWQIERARADVDAAYAAGGG